MRHILMWSEQVKYKQTRVLEFGRASSQIATEETEGRICFTIYRLDMEDHDNSSVTMIPRYLASGTEDKT